MKNKEALIKPFLEQKKKYEFPNDPALSPPRDEKTKARMKEEKKKRRELRK